MALDPMPLAVPISAAQPARGVDLPPPIFIF